MRAKALFVALLFFSLFAISGAQQRITSVNYTYANATVNAAQQYVDTINQSAYLIFNPDLKTAYGYLAKAHNALNVSPSTATAYANRAIESATAQYDAINAYRNVSAVVEILVAAVLATFLMKVMRGRKAGSKRIKTATKKGMHARRVPGKG